MITIKEYAESKGVSTQAVYKQLKTHEQKLMGHIRKIKGKRYLDEEAVEYLNAQSENTPSVIVQNGNDELLDELRAENKQLRERVDFLQRQMIQELMKQNTTIYEQNKTIAELTEKVLLLTEQKQEPKRKWWQFGK